MELSKLTVDALRETPKEKRLSEKGKKLELRHRRTCALEHEARQLEIQNGIAFKAINDGNRIGRGWDAQCPTIDNDRMKAEPEQQRADDTMADDDAMAGDDEASGPPSVWHEQQRARKFPAERKREGGCSIGEGASRLAPLDEDRQMIIQRT